MAQLDRFFATLASSGASALHLVPDGLATLAVGDAERPITRQALTGAQLRVLVAEIAPASMRHAIEGGSGAEFTYAVNGARYSVQVVPEKAGPRVVARPQAVPAAASAPPAAAPAASAPEAPSAPAPAPAAAPPSAPAERASGPVASTAEPAVRDGGEPAHDEEARARLDELLREMVRRDASDLHLRVGEPPILRQHGEMRRMEDLGAMENGVLERILRSIMPPRNRREYDEANDTDFAYEIEGLARFRCNALRERLGAGAVFRVIPARVVTADELGISDEVQRLCHLPRGLVLVTGPTGSGKSTTLSSLIDLMNRTRTDHIITIEDPIEFVHRNKGCIITQRQVGVHTASFKQALRAALREDPDVILVGELRDLETVSIAIETAETGHLVFGTLHTTSAVSTVDRLIDQFPADRQAQIRVMLSESLKGVISQVLCKKIGGGRVAAREILLSIPAISNLIREGKTFQIPSILQTSKRLGMVTLNDALIELVNAKLVEPREAYLKASDKAGFAAMLKAHHHDTAFLESEMSVAGAGPKGESPARPTGRAAAVR